MRAWCRHTRGRFERTHGDVFNGHTRGRRVIASSAYQNLPTYGNQVLQRFTKQFLDLSLIQVGEQIENNMSPIPPIIRFT